MKIFSDEIKADEELVRQIYKPRNPDANKGNFGKTAIVAGSFGKIGAAVLAVKAAMRTGSGITFAVSADCGYDILQSQCPEAMFISAGKNFVEEINVEEDYTVGIGPGIGKGDATKKALEQFLKSWRKPVVLDADALNIMSENPELLKLIPKNSIITPHPKEFERLFGKSENAQDMLQLAIEKSQEFGIIIVLKGHETAVILPEENVYKNTTGNAGMAKGGSGDALTGMVTALLAQNYPPEKAAVFGVWLHGKAGDLAAKKYSQEAMLPLDLIDEIGNVFKLLK